MRVMMCAICIRLERIKDLQQVKTVRRRTHSSDGSVTCIKHPGRPIDWLPSFTNFDQCSHDISDHVVKKTIRFDFDCDPFAICVLETFDEDVTNSSHRADTCGTDVLVGGEIVGTPQLLSCLTHCRRVELLPDTPGMLAGKD